LRSLVVAGIWALALQAFHSLKKAW